MISIGNMVNQETKSALGGLTHNELSDKLILRAAGDSNTPDDLFYELLERAGDPSKVKYERSHFKSEHQQFQEKLIDALLRNKKTPQDFVWKAIQNKKIWDFRAAAAQYPNLTIAMFEALAADESPHVKIVLMEHKELPEGIFFNFSDDDSASVRREFVKHITRLRSKKERQRTLLKLAVDPDEGVRFEVAKSPEAPEKALDILKSPKQQLDIQKAAKENLAARSQKKALVGKMKKRGGALFGKGLEIPTGENGADAMRSITAPVRSNTAPLQSIMNNLLASAALKNAKNRNQRLKAIRDACKGYTCSDIAINDLADLKKITAADIIQIMGRPGAIIPPAPAEISPDVKIEFGGEGKGKAKGGIRIPGK